MPLSAVSAQVATVSDPGMKIVFRKYRDGDVIALFCGSAVDCNPGNVTAYMHVGQHGEASRDLGRNLKLASPDEYRDLKREIETIYERPVQPVNRLRA